MATTTNAPAQPAAATDAAKSVRIYEYSDLVYWWAIWFAALVGIVLTLLFGESIQIGHKALKVHPSPWVGIGFLTIMFATLIFTQLRARGIYAVIMALVIALIGLLVHMTIGWTAVFDQLTLIRVHMNLAFYVIVFVVSFVICLYTALLPGRLSYGMVNPGEIGWRTPLTGQMVTHKPLNFQVTKHSDDIVVHTLLGLRFLGLGTGDIDVKFD